MSAALKNAAVCRLLEVDFETASITLKALGQKLPPLAAGNYVVMPQADFTTLRAMAGLYEPLKAALKVHGSEYSWCESAKSALAKVAGNQ